MVDKVKQDICELVNNSTNYDTLDLVWKILLSDIDRELAPSDCMTESEGKTWEKQKRRNSRKKN